MAAAPMRAEAAVVVFHDPDTRGAGELPRRVGCGRHTPADELAIGRSHARGRGLTIAPAELIGAEVVGLFEVIR